MFLNFQPSVKVSNWYSPLGFKDFLVSSNANALDDKHFSSNASDAMRGRGEKKYRENKSDRSSRFYFRGTKASAEERGYSLL